MVRLRGRPTGGADVAVGAVYSLTANANSPANTASSAAPPPTSGPHATTSTTRAETATTVVNQKADSTLEALAINHDCNDLACCSVLLALALQREYAASSTALSSAAGRPGGAGTGTSASGVGILAA